MVEALVTLVIFGIGTIALLQVAPRASQFALRSQSLSAATNLAQAKIEELRALPAAHADLDSGWHVDGANPINGRYVRRWEVTLDSPIQGMRRVDVRVGFNTLSPDSLAVLTTYF